MPSKAPTPCLRCGSLGDCEHRGAARRHRSSRAWTERSRRVREAWIAVHGPWCPGWGRDAHEVDPADLTVDHATALAVGGDDGDLTVLCRSCNARKGPR